MIVNRSAKFLLDSGCITNLLSRRLFDTLSVQVRKQLEPYEGSHGTLADGSSISFYGIIEFAGSVCSQAIQEMFIVGQSQEDAILGMPFLQRHRCSIDFKKSVVMMGDKELTCVDKFGRPQVIQSCTMLSRSQATVSRKADGGSTSRSEIVKSTHARVPPARGCNRPIR